MQAIKSVLKLLVELMEEWHLILTEKAQGTFHEPVSSAATKSGHLFSLVANTAMPCFPLALWLLCLPSLSAQLSSCSLSDNLCRQQTTRHMLQLRVSDPKMVAASSCVACTRSFLNCMSALTMHSLNREVMAALSRNISNHAWCDREVVGCAGWMWQDWRGWA